MSPMWQQYCANPKFTRFFFGKLALKQPPAIAQVF